MIDITTQERIRIEYKTICTPDTMINISGWQFTIERKDLSNVVSNLYSTLPHCMDDLSKLVNVEA